MSEQESMDFEVLFNKMMKWMKTCGIYPDQKKDGRWYAQFALTLALNFVIWYLLLYTILHDFSNGIYDELCMTGFMFLLTNLMATKYLLILTKSADIKEIMDRMNVHYKQMNDLIPSDQEIVKEGIEKAHFLNKLWTAMVLATGIIFPVRTILIMIYLATKGDFHLVQVFHLVYPSYLSGINEDVLYVLTTTFTMTYDAFLLIIFIGSESLGPIFMIHGCYQLEIVKQKLLRVFKDYSDSDEIELRLRDIAIRLQDIYGFVEKINDIYSTLYEFCLGITAVAIPIIGIQVIKRIQGMEPNPEELICMAGCFVHIYVPCHYSEMLKEKSEDIRQAMYACGWETNPVTKHRRTLLIMMVRALRPALIRTIFKVVSLDEFANMIRTSYTLFNLLSLNFL